MKKITQQPWGSLVYCDFETFASLTLMTSFYLGGYRHVDNVTLSRTVLRKAAFLHGHPANQEKVTNQLQTTFHTYSTLPTLHDTLTSWESVKLQTDTGKLRMNTLSTVLQTSFVFVKKIDWRWFTMNCLWTDHKPIIYRYLHKHRVCEPVRKQNACKCIPSFTSAVCNKITRYRKLQCNITTMCSICLQHCLVPWTLQHASPSTYVKLLSVTLVHNTPLMQQWNTDISWNRLMLRCYTLMLFCYSHIYPCKLVRNGITSQCYITVLHSLHYIFVPTFFNY